MGRAWHERLHCVRGDLTHETVDAIVNAANSRLAGGGGVDGAIHAAAGPGLLEECGRLHPGGCPVGESRLTAGHGLAAHHVIHTVGPIWAGGGAGEAERLHQAYASSLELAAREGFETISYPAISTGVYRYPREAAAEISLAALGEGLERHPGIRLVRIVLFSDELHATFERARERRMASHPDG